MDFSNTPLKDMDAAMLVLAIQQATGYHTKVCKALELAAYCHHGKVRANPTRNSKGQVYQGTSPYIEHPLRVALRLIRWGVTDFNVIAAALLHDTVEDHPEKIAPKGGCFGFQSAALSRIEYEFNKTVASYVKSLTNDPIRNEDKGVAIIGYINKVSREIQRYEVFIIKFSDFCDNALGLHHQQSNPKMVKKLANKYIGLVPIFISQFVEFQSNGVDFSPDFIRRLNEAKPYLEDLING